MPVQWAGLAPPLLVDVRRDIGLPLRAQLEGGLRDAIRSGRLPVGERLPSSRELARQLGLSRGLVQECYGQLLAEARHSSIGLRSAEDQVLDQLGDKDVRDAMQQLPEKLRTAVYYADIEGRRFKEIAELTNAPIGTVMSRLHRGRHRLRALLADVARDRGYGLDDVA